MGSGPSVGPGQEKGLPSRGDGGAVGRRGRRGQGGASGGVENCGRQEGRAWSRTELGGVHRATVGGGGAEARGVVPSLSSFWERGEVEVSCTACVQVWWEGQAAPRMVRGPSLLCPALGGFVELVFLPRRSLGLPGTRRRSGLGLGRRRRVVVPRNLVLLVGGGLAGV